MERNTENGKDTHRTSQKKLQAEKENLFLKYLHVPISSSYEGYPSETRSTPSEMKDLSNEVELEKMATQGEIHKESEKNSLCLKKGTAARKVLCDNKDNLDESLDDFHDSQIEKKQKLKKRHENAIFACVMCQADITHLDLNERAIHVNQCIDGQSSTVIPSQETTTENAFILDCPLCFKRFPTPEVRSAHIKKCGKSRGLSTQSVIQALRLQEKHVLERRALGLPLNNKPTKQPKKTAAKKFLTRPKSTMESDIHLAKALSLSLEENENKMPTNFDSADSEDSIQSTAILQAPSEFQNPGKIVSKKKTLKPTPLLLLRSEEERQKILIEKVNSVITSLSEFKSDVVIEEDKHDTTEQKRTILWNICGQAEDKKAYYVEQLLDWVSPSDVEVGSKLCNLSQIAGHHILTQLPCDYTFSSGDKIGEDSAGPEDIESPSLIKSLRSLIGNSWMSDVDIHTASGIVIPAHKLFLALRCPSLKNAFDETVASGRHVLHWENTSFDAALHFLNFIYTGSAEWKEDIIDELHQLAVKYKVHDLLNILDSNKETLEMLICEDGKENTEDSVMDTEVRSEGNSQDTEPPAQQKHDLNENNKNPATECQNANDGYFKDKDESNETAYANSENLRSLVSDQDDIVCIQHIKVAKETVDIENISSERDRVDEDIFILNKYSSSYANTKNQTYNLNVETIDIDSASSFGSCKISKPRVSSESKTYFDTFQEDVINIVCSEMPNTSKGSVYCTSTYTTPSQTLVKTINPPFEKSSHSGNVLSPKLSPYIPHTTKSYEYISPEIPCYSRGNTNSPGNSLSLFSKTEFKVVSSKEKSSSSPNFRNEKINDAVIILENESSESGTRETSHGPFLKESCSVGSPENRIFSSRKISPWKISKSKSPSLKDFEPVPGSQNIFVENKSVNFEQRDLDVQHLYQKDCSASPDASRFPNSREILSNCYELSPKARPRISSYDKDKSFKRNLECSLNEDVYPMNFLSSPEILVCDSDNEYQPIVEKSSSSKTQDWGKECSSNREVGAVLCKENYEMPNSENSSSSIKDKTVVPEIICCNSDDDANVTVGLQSTCERKNINSDRRSELNEPKFIQCDGFSDENECTSVRTIANDPVLDVIDCCSNSNDNEDVIERLQSSSQTTSKTKETTIEDEDEYIPLSQRIEAAKSKTNFCKAFEDLEPPSPESPWTFQTNKQCAARPPEKDQNKLKSSSSTSQQSYDSTPKHLPKKGKSKNAATGNQTERGNFVMALHGLQPKFKISDSPVTPLPDYKSMVTPDLKQALKRVGVKPLPRKKAVAVLSHIYNETHPWNDGKTEESLESQTQSSPKSTKNLSLPKKRKQTNEISDQPSKKTVKSHPKVTTQANEAATKINSKPKNSSNKNQPSSSGQKYPSETKTSSPDISSSPDGSHNSRGNYYNLSSDFSDSSQPDSKDNITNVTQYILSNDELYKKVLTYSPLNLMEFQHELKENGISISVQKLMDYLDEQCITFTCPRKEEYKKKQQARTQRFRKRMIAKMSQQKS